MAPQAKGLGSSQVAKKGGSKEQVVAKGTRGGVGSSLYAGKGGRILNVPKWNVTEYQPPRKISDKELEAARKMFFELDRDGSGSIDAEELGMMLRSLGQNPTEEELVELINSVDDGDMDGQMQLREFLKLYTQGLDSKSGGGAGKEDIANVFISLGGNPADPESKINKDAIYEAMKEHYDLDVDVDVTFGPLSANDFLTKAQLETILTNRDTEASR